MILLFGKIIPDFKRAYADGSTLIVEHTDGQQTVFPLPDVQTAKKQLASVINTFSNVFSLTDVLPRIFDIRTDTITVFGSLFDPSKLGLIYIDDAGGGTDANGYSMTPTFINSQTFSAAFNSAGDAVLGSPGDAVLFYYKDNTSAKTNILNGIVISGTQIQIVPDP